MLDIIRQMTFREFVYEDDSEAVVDMHRCYEKLEGSWFDDSHTCRTHAKIVTRTPGSKWVIAFERMIFAHASLLKLDKNTAVVTAFRLHQDLRHPMVAKKLYDGLCQQATKRNYASIVFFADSYQAVENYKLFSLKTDREYRMVDILELDKGINLTAKPTMIYPEDFEQYNLKPFLGTPLPPEYIIERSILAAERRFFSFTKPQLFEIVVEPHVFIACHDGREWHVFRKGDFKAEPETVNSILTTISKAVSGSSKIMLNSKALNITGLVPVNDGVLYDYHVSL